MFRHLLLVILIGHLFSATVAASSPDFSTTHIDQNINTGYALYPAGANHKILSNSGGVFLTHVLHENGNQYTWRLSRSTDQGQTFNTMTTQVGGTRAPVLLTNSQQWLYLLFPDWNTGHGQIWIYKPQDNYSSPTQISVPNAGYGAGKFTAAIDETKGKIYFFTGNYDGQFFILNLQGQLLNSYRLVVPTAQLGIMYPYLFQSRHGELYAAWAGARISNSGLRGPIFFAVTSDGGQTWHNLRGVSLPLNQSADGGSGNDQVSLPADFEANKDIWLSTMFVNDSHLHFRYIAANDCCGLNNQALQRHIRFNLQTGGKQELTGDSVTLTSPTDFRLDGYATSCSSHQEQGDIYCLARDSHLGYSTTQLGLVVIASQDNGSSWQPYLKFPLPNPGSFDLALDLSSDGWYLGSTSNANQDPARNNVYFLKFKPGTFNTSFTSSPLPLPGDFTGDGHVDLFDYNKLVANFGHPYSLFDYNTLVANFGR